METTAEIHPHRLTRSRDNRVLGGVAAGIGQYFDLDPVLVRVAFAALLVFGGSGLWLYLVGWMLIPEDGAERSIVADVLHGDGTRRRGIFTVIVAILVAVAAVNLLVGLFTWPHRAWTPGGGMAFVVLLAALFVFAAGRGERRHNPVLLVLGGLFTAVVAVTAITCAAVFGFVALSDVPMRGGFGDRHWHPAASSELHRAYHLTAGNLTVDLTDVRLPARVTHLDTTVAMGHVLVRVPRDADVSVSAHSGAGEVVVFGNHDDGFGADRSVHAAGTSTDTPSTGDAVSRPRLVLDAEAGIGVVEVVRAGE